MGVAPSVDFDEKDTIASGKLYEYKLKYLARKRGANWDSCLLATIVALATTLITMLASEALAAAPFSNQGARLKDIAAVKGVRENILIGYGLVVGLKGSGDSSADVTAKSLGRLFGKLGLDVDKSTSVKSKNAAAVIVTAKFLRLREQEIQLMLP